MSSPYKFRIPLTPPVDDWLEYIPPETIVEQSGWRSTEQIVSSMQEAGLRLQAYRRGQFDYTEDIGENDEIVSDPLRKLDLDYVDVDRIASKARLAADSYVKAQEALKDVQEPVVAPSAPVVASSAPVVAPSEPQKKF